MYLKPNQRRFLSLLWSLVFLLPLYSASRTPGSVKELEKEKDRLTSEIAKLAVTSLNSGVSPIGYRSRKHLHASNHEWVEINLSRCSPIDKIFIVPAIWRNRDGQFQTDAFPQDLTVSGITEDRDIEVLFKSSDTSDLLPRISPIAVPISTKRSFNKIKIATHTLGQRAIDNAFIFQLAEVYVFHSYHNLALRQKVTVPHEVPKSVGWAPHCLVDGVSPYLMDTPLGESSRAYVSNLDTPNTPELILRVSPGQEIDGLRLHTVDQGDTMPQTFPGDFGLPRHFTLESSSAPTFASSRVLLDARISSLYEAGPILEWHFPPTKQEFIKLKALLPYLSDHSHQNVPRIGFSEIELLNKGLRVDSLSTISANFQPAVPSLQLDSLIDKNNIYGAIIPVRSWLEELSLRHEYEAQYQSVNQRLNRTYQRQKDILQVLSYTLFIFACLFIVFFFQQRYQRIKQEIKIRERIASNLHDELGANLHAIGHLGELVEETLDTPDDLKIVVNRMRSLTKQTGNAARDCSHMLRHHELCDDLVREMKRLSERLLADLTYQFTITGEQSVAKLPRQARIDLLLFYKEALINVIRHSQAQSVHIRLSSHISFLTNITSLEIQDDGIGLQDTIPPSLQRRARFLRGSLENTSQTESGTQLTLKLSRLCFKKP